MICKNCSAEYDDSAAQCPECGMENETATARFDSDARPAEEFEEQSDEGEKSAEGDSTDAPSEEKTEETADENEEDVQAASDEKKEPEAEEKAPLKKRRTVRRALRPAGKEEKRVIAFIVFVVCLIGICAGVVTFMNITTDVFRVDDSDEKVVAGVGLTPQEEKQLEEVVSDFFSVAKKGFSRDDISTEAFIADFNPGDKGNVYSAVNGATEALQTEADPAGRFADENGEYAYYKVDEKKVDKVLSLFGLESHRGENRENYYYCEGYYYFAVQDSKSSVVSAEVTKTAKVLDGSFYAECYFYKQSGEETAKSKTCYLLFEAQKDEATGESAFTVKKISAKKLFGSDGKLLSSAKGTEKKTEVIEGRTKKGKLFSRYIIEYPVVSGEDAGSAVVRDFFSNAVSVYEMKAESADEEYTSYKAAGGDVNQLPFEENVVASIVYEDESNISFKGVISALSPEENEAADVEYGQEAEETAPRLYERRVEAYTIDRQSGNFVSKDSVIGRDHTLISELLYRIYNGYEYENLFAQEETDSYYYDETPEDVNGQGTAIYESAWALTEKGVTFYYVTEEGYVSEVTIPEAIVEKLV